MQLSAGACYCECQGTAQHPNCVQVGKLITELASAGEQELGITLDGDLVDRLCAYGESVASFPTALKEQEWRNGWFLSLSNKALTNGEADPCPLHSQWLAEASA